MEEHLQKLAIRMPDATIQVHYNYGIRRSIQERLGTFALLLSLFNVSVRF